jgi:hypothetical protein
MRTSSCSSRGDQQADATQHYGGLLRFSSSRRSAAHYEGGAALLCAPEQSGRGLCLLLPTDWSLRHRTSSSVRQGTRGTIAHEFRHMINAGNR